MSTYIAFGLAGTGKTYFASWFASTFNVHFEDADHWITPEMRAYIREGKVFTPEMLDTYFAIVSANIHALTATHPNLIISQALYLEQNRQQLLAAHPDITYILVSTNQAILENRLLARSGEVTLQYAKKNEPFFEAPTHPCIIIDNSRHADNQHLMQQCLSHAAIASLSNQGMLHRLFSPTFKQIKQFCQRHLCGQSRTH